MVPGRVGFHRHEAKRRGGEPLGLPELQSAIAFAGRTAYL
jgi:hypothetical protein